MGRIAGALAGFDDPHGPCGTRTRGARADGRSMVGPCVADPHEPGCRTRGSGPACMERSLPDQRAADALADAAPVPQWEPVRQAYVAWDPRRRQWLQFDQASQQWLQYDAVTALWRPVVSGPPPGTAPGPTR